MKQRIVFWQHTPSMHQSAFLSALASTPAVRVSLVTTGPLESNRIAMGWRRPEFLELDWRDQPTYREIEQLLDQDPTESVHMFSGLSAYSSLREPLRLARKRALAIGVIAEPPDPRGLKGLLRRATYKLESLRLRRSISFVLATGQQGVDWYCDSGFSSNTVYEFGYFVDNYPLPPENNVGQGPDIRLVYVGQMVQRKGVDLLIEALASLREYHWQLDLIGDGPVSKALRQASEYFGIADRVRWHGYADNESARTAIARADYLVLPSRFDGWGAVVNEALGVGTAVLCSSKCGASALINSTLQGEVFDPTIAALGGVLERALQRVTATRAVRSARGKWAQEHVSAHAATQYFLQVLESRATGRGRPTPPWHAAS